MNFLGNIWNFLFGKKDKQDQQQAAPQSRPVSTSPASFSQPAANPIASTYAIPTAQPQDQQPQNPVDNSLHLFSMPSQLQKAHQPQPPVQPAPQTQPQPVNQAFQDQKMRQIKMQQYQNDSEKASQDAAFWGKVAGLSNTLGKIPVVSALAKPATWALGHEAQQVADNPLLKKYVPAVSNAASGISQSAQDVNRRMTMDMSNEQFNQIPAQDRWKYTGVQGFQNLISPLDLVAAESLIKAPLTAGVTALVKNGVTKEGLNVVSQAAKSQLPSGVVGAAAGGGLTAGVQKFLTGKVDPGSVLHGALTGLGLGFLAPGKVASPTEADVPVKPNIPMEADLPGQPHTPGIRSVNPQKEALLKVPTNVGEADAQARVAGGVRLPDQTFSGDARAIEATKPENLLDIPTFLRQNADNVIQNGQDTLNSLDQRTGLIKAGNGPIQDFTNAQRIAAAFQKSPEAGRAQAELIRRQQAAFDPQQALIKAAQERASAVADIHQAQQAKAAQAVLDAQAAKPEAAVPTEVLAPHPAAPVETAPPALETAPVPAPEPMPQLPPTPDVQAQPVAPQPEVPNVAPTNGQVPPQTVQQPVPQTANPVNVVGGVGPNAEAGRIAPNAPDIRATLQKQLGDVAQNLEGAQSYHDVISNADLQSAAQRVVATLTPEELVQQYEQGFNPQTLDQVAQGQAALPRLAEMSRNGDLRAGAAIDNILQGAETSFSNSGRVTNFAQTFYDSMPREAKVSWLIRQIDKERALNPDKYPPIKQDVAYRAQVESKIDSLLSQSEKQNEAIASLEGEAQKFLDNPTEGVDPAKFVDAYQQVQDLRQELERQGGELAKYWATLVPDQVAGQRKFGDFARTMMLTSVLGRANDVATTSFNTLDAVTNMAGSAAVGKVLNAVPGERTPLISKMPSLDLLKQGAKRGLAKSKGEFGGNVYTEDVNRLLQQTKAQKATGKAGVIMPIRPGAWSNFRRFVRAGAELATNLSQGIEDVRLQQLAEQEGRALGYSGKQLEGYTAARMINASRVMRENANQFHEIANNLNDNWLTDAVESTYGGIAKIPYVGEALRNSTFPFTRWVSAQAYNAITDRNVVANMIKIGKAIKQGDQQAVVDNSVKFAKNFGMSATMGYGLAQMGLLSTTDPQGNKYDGLYLHLGDHYIPTGFLGAANPSILMGAATYNAFHDGSNEPIQNKIGKAIGDTFEMAFNSLSGDQLTGQSNNFVRNLNDLQKGYENLGDFGTRFAADTAGTMIPAITGDVNWFLNNHTALNPTKEAPLTKVTKTSEAGNEVIDRVPTAINQQLSRIPFVSQGLPRNQGVAAPDLIDRVTHGSHATEQQNQVMAAAKTEAQIKQDFVNRGVPFYGAKGYSDAIDALVQKGDYQTAAEAKQAELAHLQQDKKAKPSDIAKVQDEVRNLTDFKPNGIPFYTDSKFSDEVQAKVERGEYDKAIPALQAKLEHDQADSNIPESKLKKQQDEITTLTVLRDNKIGPNTYSLYKGSGADGITVAEWRNMGDPNSDSYNPQMYELLYELDTKLAEAGVSRNTTDPHKNYYTAKKAGGTGRGRGGSRAAGNGNLIGAIPTLSKVTFGNLVGKQVNLPQQPAIKQLAPGDLVKKRKISVGRS